MTEQYSNFQNNELPQTPEQPNLWVYTGHVAVDSWMAAEPDPMYHIQIIDGKNIQSNLPEGIKPFLSGGENKVPLITIADMDTLPPGKYEMSEQGNEGMTSRSLTITNHDGYTRISHATVSVERRPYGQGAGRLMEDLGFIVDSTMPRESPTPSTLKEKAAQLGVSVRFFERDGLINSRDYLAAFADGEYPVALGESSYYGHDISDDHLTTMVLGGEQLKSVLSGAAKKALTVETDAQLDAAADAVDRYTGALRRLVNSKGVDAHELPEYDSGRGRETLRKNGLELGIDPDTSDQLLKIVQQCAAEYGIPVKELLQDQ